MVNWKEHSMSTGLAVASSRGVLPYRSITQEYMIVLCFPEKPKAPMFGDCH